MSESSWVHAGRGVTRNCMSKDLSPATVGQLLPTAKRRALLLVAMVVGLAGLASLDVVHGGMMDLLGEAESIMRTRPVLGRVVFVAAAALSAMLAFVSSAVIIPVAVFVWGQKASILLLWAGWTLGGAAAYGVSRYLGRPVVNALSSRAVLEAFESRVSGRTPFGLVVLLQLALPSELPGYLLGMVRYPFWKYLCALAVAELPYAAATIYLGASLIDRRLYRLVVVAAVVAAFSGWALYSLRARMGSGARG